MAGGWGGGQKHHGIGSEGRKGGTLGLRPVCKREPALGGSGEGCSALGTVGAKGPR